METQPKPYWWPDARGFVIGAIVVICALALFIRMFHTGPQDDKMLDTMITILFSTCLVAIVNFLFGSSRNADAKDDTQNKIVERLAPPPTDKPAA